MPEPQHALRFGAFVPQGWKLEYAGWPAADAWHRSVELAQLAESLGYDHLWVYDHVETVPRREPEVMFEAFTTLAALSQRTERVGLGQLVTCSSYRNVGLLAKEAACVDVFSGGRLILGLGAGWFSEEYESYGYRYPGDRERLDVLEETVVAIRRLWTDATVTIDGPHHHLTGAHAEPKPLQRLPPIWIGGGGERVTLKIAARHADATNWQVGPAEFRHKSEVLRRHCADIGRDCDEITRTHAPDCLIVDSAAELRSWLDSPEGGNLWNEQPDDEYVRDNFVGTTTDVAGKVQEFIDAGCREFVLWFRDYPDDRSLRRFMTEVAPLVGV
ncbi:MAG: TIGR03560 family F420-dependent LLM class oxidoreductase [Acidimicrobiia bacterium]